MMGDAESESDKRCSSAIGIWRSLATIGAGVGTVGGRTSLEAAARGVLRARGVDVPRVSVWVDMRASRLGASDTTRRCVGDAMGVLSH